MSTSSSLDELASRCTFPSPGTSVACAFSGGPDSTALIALAKHAGLDVTAHHVDHGIRPTSSTEARHAAEIARQVGVSYVLHTVVVEPGPNLEGRARDARQRTLPPGAMTGHTADDQAETLLLRLIRGSGSTGLAAIEPGLQHPMLSLRRSETHEVCAMLDLDPVRDPSNDSPDMWRNRVRSELIPLAADIAERDVTPLMARTAALLRVDNDLLDELAAEIDPTDAKAVANAHIALGRRALRRWLTVDGYPPDAAAIERVLAVARGDSLGCELPGGVRVRRSQQKLSIEPPEN